MSLFVNISKSGVKSPEISNTVLFKKPNFSFQSNTLSFPKDFNGAIYIIFPCGLFSNTLKIANSAIAVFPLPVGAPHKIFSSEL